MFVLAGAGYYDLVYQQTPQNVNLNCGATDFQAETISTSIELPSVAQADGLLQCFFAFRADLGFAVELKLTFTNSAQCCYAVSVSI